jgi:hypothetical protein
LTWRQRRWDRDGAEIDAHIAAVAAGELDLTLAPLISACGRRPDYHL